MKVLRQANHVVPSQNHLGEGPIWDAKNQCLYWVDLFMNQIHYWVPEMLNSFETIRLEHMISAIGLRKDGLVLASNDGVLLSSRNGHIERRFALPIALQHGAHSNDGAVDRQGRFWLGTAAGENPDNQLYQFNGNCVFNLMETDIGISNGIAWSPDDRTMYYVDSPKQVIYAYDFDAVTGSITNRRNFLHIPKSAGAPDGLTVDSEGYIWCALWDGWRVIRISPQGVIVDEIPLPVQRPTSCTFGGEDLNTLFITSARTGLSRQDLNKQPYAGDLFAVDVSVGGFRETYFKG